MRNKTACKTPSKNPYLTIKIKDIACNFMDTKEFRIQIEELLWNNLIRWSFNSHRLVTFFGKKP